MKKVTVTCAALSDDADGFAASQTPVAAGNLTLAGALTTAGVGTATAGQRVTITAAANDSGRTFTVTGTDADGVACTEAITGPNTTTATGAVYFKTVTQIAVDAACAGAITAGPLKANGGVAPTIKVEAGEFGVDFNPALFVDVVSGTYTVEMTPLESTDTHSNGYSNSVTWFPISEFSAKTADVAAVLSIPCHGIRLRSTTNTSGDVVATYISREPK